MASYDVFGLQKLEVYDPSANSWKRIQGVENAKFEESAEDVEVKGDDTIIAKWRYGQKGTLTWKANRVDFDVVSIVTGEEVNDELDGGESIYGMTENSLYPRDLAFRLTQLARRVSDGKLGTLVTTIFKVNGAVRNTGQSYGDPTSMEFEGVAIPTDKDHTGQSLPQTAGFVQRFIPES
jgi:hypothetical protein